MKRIRAFAALGMIVSGSVMADETATITSGGISLYSVSKKGIALVKGSPFVPSTPIYGNPYVCGSSLTTQPIFIQQTLDHSTVYALYAPCQSQDVLVKYKVASTALSEVTSSADTPFTTMGNHHNVPSAMVLGPQHSLIFYYRPAYSVFSESAALYNSELNNLIQVSGYFDTDGTRMDLTSLQVDPSGKFYYVCAGGAAGGNARTSVSAFLFDSTTGDVLTKGSASYPVDSTLISRSTDPETVSAFCPE